MTPLTRSRDRAPANRSPAQRLFDLCSGPKVARALRRLGEQVSEEVVLDDSGFSVDIQLTVQRDLVSDLLTLTLEFIHPLILFCAAPLRSPLVPDPDAHLRIAQFSEVVSEPRDLFPRFPLCFHNDGIITGP